MTPTVLALYPQCSQVGCSAGLHKWSFAALARDAIRDWTVMFCLQTTTVFFLLAANNTVVFESLLATRCPFHSNLLLLKENKCETNVNFLSFTTSSVFHCLSGPGSVCWPVCLLTRQPSWNIGWENGPLLVTRCCRWFVSVNRWHTFRKWAGYL